MNQFFQYNYNFFHGNSKCLLNITYAYGVYLYGLCLHGGDIGEGIRVYKDGLDSLNVLFPTVKVTLRGKICRVYKGSVDSLNVLLAPLEVTLREKRGEKKDELICDI